MKYSAMAQPAYGAMYCRAAGSAGGGRHDDGVLHGAARAQRLHDAGHHGGLLAHGDVDADHALALLVDDRVHGQGFLAGAAVPDQKLALSLADGHHRVDGLHARLQGLLHRLAVADARAP